MKQGNIDALNFRRTEDRLLHIEIEERALLYNCGNSNTGSCEHERRARRKDINFDNSDGITKRVGDNKFK